MQTQKMQKKPERYPVTAKQIRTLPSLVIGLATFNALLWGFSLVMHVPLTSAFPLMYLPISLLAGLSLLAGGSLATRLASGISQESFYHTAIISTSLCTTCTIFGLNLFFVGMPPILFAGFTIASLIVIVSLIIPKVIRYNKMLIDAEEES